MLKLRGFWNIYSSKNLLDIRFRWRWFFRFNESYLALCSSSRWRLDCWIMSWYFRIFRRFSSCTYKHTPLVSLLSKSWSILLPISCSFLQTPTNIHISSLCHQRVDQYCYRIGALFFKHLQISSSRLFVIKKLINIVTELVLFSSNTNKYPHLISLSSKSWSILLQNWCSFLQTPTNIQLSSLCHQEVDQYCYGFGALFRQMQVQTGISRHFLFQQLINIDTELVLFSSNNYKHPSLLSLSLKGWSIFLIIWCLFSLNTKNISLCCQNLILLVIWCLFSLHFNLEYTHILGNF